jgi:hypothetical protein
MHPPLGSTVHPLYIGSFKPRHDEISKSPRDTNNKFRTEYNHDMVLKINTTLYVRDFLNLEPVVLPQIYIPSLI